MGSLNGASDRRPSRDNDVDVQTNEFGDERREAICSSFRPQLLDDNVFSFDVPKLAQSPTKCIDADRVTGSRPTAQKSYPRDFGRLLRPDGERRNNETESENDPEPDQPPGHLCERWLAASLAERPDAHQHRAARPAATGSVGPHGQHRRWDVSRRPASVDDQRKRTAARRAIHGALRHSKSSRRTLPHANVYRKNSDRRR